MIGITATALGAILLAVTGAPPHDGPAVRIKALTKRMATVGRTAERLFQRSMCYAELRQYRSALDDLHGAIELDPAHERALVEHVRVLVALQKPDDALASALKARPLLRTPAFRARLSRVEANLLTARKHYGLAIAHLDAALRHVPNQPGVILHRSILRGLLGQRDLRVRELETLVDEPSACGQSPIVEAAWVDALIDAGRFGRARKVVETRLRESRFQSAWLLRRARIHMGMGQAKLAEADLMSALRELTSRIRPESPDLLLVADRAAALHLLGREKASRSDQKLLRTKHYPALLQLRLQLIVRGS
jgi:tetratricopeptide (TPR) repeat protein